MAEPTRTQAENDFTTSFEVARRPTEVYEAILDPRRWWSEGIVGNTRELGSVFYYHFQDVHRCTIEVAELVPGKRVAWRVLQNYFDFIADKREWTGTTVVFDIVPEGNTTRIEFTHVGLRPSHECYEVCSDAWGSYITRSLKDLIEHGRGQPNAKDGALRLPDARNSRAREVDAPRAGRRSEG